MGSSGDLGPWDDRVLVRAYESAVRKYQGAHGLKVDPVPEQTTEAAPEARSPETSQVPAGTSAPANPPPVHETSAKMASLEIEQQESTAFAGTPQAWAATDDVYAQYEDPSGWQHYQASGGLHSYSGQEGSTHPHPPPGGPPPPPLPPHHLSPAAALYPEGFSHHKHPPPPPPPPPGGDHPHPRPVPPPPHGPPHPPAGHRPPPPSHWHGHRPPVPPPCQAGGPWGHHLYHPPPPPPYYYYPYAYPPPPPYCGVYWGGHGGAGLWAGHRGAPRQREAPPTVWFPSAEEEVSSVKAEGPASEACPSEAAAAPDGGAAGAPPMPTVLPQDREELAALLMVWYKAGYQTASYLQGQNGGP